jgi:hypothetical protein
MVLSLQDKKFNEEQLKKSQKLGINNSDQIVKYYSSNYSNIRTLTNKLSMAKKYFEQNGYDKKFLMNLYPGKNITREVIRENTKVLERTKAIQIKKSFVDNIINTFHSSTEYPKLAIYLLLASGRRLNEIIDSKYVADPNDESRVIVDVLLKKRGENENNYSIKIIGDRDTFLRSMKTFKNLILGISHSTAQQGIQTYIRKYYTIHGLPTSHYFRVLYANYLYKYHNPDNLIYNVYLKNILNHNSLLTSINYTSLTVV